MKKNKAAVFMMAVIMFFILVGCEQNKIPKIEEISGNTPDWKDLPSENMRWGIGTGDLSTVNASCEQAKFNAQADICRQIMTIEKSVITDDPLSDLYQNELYTFLSLYCADQASFELSEFIKIERRARTSDGTIWYLVSLSENDVIKIQSQISQYYETMFNDYIETLEDTLSQSASFDDEELLRRLDEEFNKLE